MNWICKDCGLTPIIFENGIKTCNLCGSKNIEKVEEEEKQ